ncbi:cobalamin adenosyltransferase [Brevibacillus daliensis]|uniref:cobalamin adenosyltransferase n=1 Tax=Brevibacillus daliensis TaxID=2892995 RepID=UPI001E2A89C5|nr:cobalamin adenosyltransferase [Brevibacillus daliensis]
MAVITESDLRKYFKNQKLRDVSEYEAPKGTILTPSAKSFLTDNQIELKYSVAKKEAEPEKSDATETSKQQENTQVTKHVTTPEATEGKGRYETIYGGFMDTKPEHMTHLHGNMLVYKDHPRIELRGKLDSLESKILEAQNMCSKVKMIKLVNDLEEILLFIRQIMRSEVLNEKIGDFLLLGMTPAELREQSHHPKRYFGMDHFQPSYEMGEAVVVINALRTKTRETELTAYQAFKQEYGSVEREDIIRGLNRLSSLFWIIMFRIRAGQYDS